MADPIERYIQNNQDTVDKWITKLFGEYVRLTLQSKHSERHYVNSNKVCFDGRRISKVLEVLRYYNILKDYKYIRGNIMYRNSQDTYDLLVDHETFLKIGKKYGKTRTFDVKAPEKDTDRTLSYPTITSLPNDFLIFFYFNQDKYELLDREETNYDNYGYAGKKTSRVIRIFPKNLESKAERAVFERTLERYLHRNVEKSFKMLYGFEPEILRAPGRYETEGTRDLQKPLKEMAVGSVHQINLSTVDKNYVKEKLAYAKRLEEYAQACIRDLTKLATEMSTSNRAFNNKLMEIAEPQLLTEAPIMMASEDKLEQELAQLLLTGSNKGLI